MTISKRTLEKWRREALVFNQSKYSDNEPGKSVIRRQLDSFQAMVRRMTQELLDQYLLEKE